jgi:glutamate N-acetyltransferase/amino-acid N-acetyltransferase
MAVGLQAPGELHPVGGIRLAATRCGIKKGAVKSDLALVELAEGSRLAAVFTQSRFSAAPVQLCRQHLSANREPRFLLINSGNANAGTGSDGLRAAVECCDAVAAPAGLEREQVLPFSTGVIAEPLPVEPIAAAIPELMGLLDGGNWLQAAQSIMTTDTLPKAVSEQCTVGGRTVNITGMAKGSGMIKPDMATMLAFVATDAEIAQPALEALLSQMVDSSFNSITVDGDTSTNDSCVLIATGASGAAVEADDTDFNSTLQSVFEQLAQAIIRDAEGATKFVEIRVDGAANPADARSIGFTIAESPLVKTALFASDPNWGRLIMAIGRAPVSRLDPDRVDLYLGQLPLLLHGLPDPAYREARGAEEMAREEICIRVDLNLGDASARIWTSDLSYEYVKINAEYRT